MRPLRLETASLEPAAIAGLVLTHDLGPDLRKGTVLSPEHLDRLRQVAEVHVVELEPGDGHEDEAAPGLGAALAGQGGLRVTSPVQSQVRILAERRGLLRVNVPVLARVNALPGIAVFTLFDGQAVDAGEEVAGSKVTPVAVPEAILREAQYLARELHEVRESPRSENAVRDAYAEAVSADAGLVLFAGASSIDPLDPAYTELDRAGGELIRFGMPAHPGSMLWMGRLGRATVLGIASCAGFGKQTSLDLVLPFVFAGVPVDLAELGHGGLVEKSAGRRFPPYPAD